jgi:hypothetical protein
MDVNSGNGLSRAFLTLKTKRNNLTIFPKIVTSNFAFWMETCLGSHKDCQKPSRTFNPTRLIEISGPDKIRLYMPAKGETTKWAALTYCWGGIQPLQTNKHTLDDWTINIPVSKLPKTIQDAIITTLKIGLKFLWVDGLCIVQDDGAEMAKEIALMPEIYRNAEVTISAAKSSGSHEGFLANIESPLPLDMVFRLPLRCPDG